MLAKTFSAAVIGIDAYPVEIEVNVTGAGTNAAESLVSIVGLPDAAVKESKDRVRSAILSSGLVPPRGSTVVNLAPADLRKEGAACRSIRWRTSATRSNRSAVVTASPAAQALRSIRRARRKTSRTSPMSKARKWPGGRWKSPPRADTTA